MAMQVHNEKELAEALQSNVDTIEIHGDLAKKTIKIKATGNVAWGVAFGAIIVAVGAILVKLGSGGVAAPVTAPVLFATAPVAAATLGIGTTVAIASTCVAAGSIAAAKLLFGKLRNDYVIAEKRSDYVLLKKK